MRRAGRGWLVSQPSADDGGVEHRGRSVRALEAAGVAARRGAKRVESRTESVSVEGEISRGNRVAFEGKQWSLQVRRFGFRDITVPL